MTIETALTWGAKQLKSKKIPSAALDAEILLTLATKKRREFFYTRPKNLLAPTSIKKYQALIKRRQTGMPIPYLSGVKEFYGHEFLVNKKVLIPRPETETLIEAALQYCKTYNLTAPKIFDVGTGSGCIAITLALVLPKAQIFATDISNPALLVARRNARRLKTKVKFYKGDLLDPLHNTEPDIIIANLPYLGTSDVRYSNPLAKSLKHEPKVALFAQSDGTALYQRLFEQVAELPRKPHVMLCEINPRHATLYVKKIKKLFPKALVSRPNRFVFTVLFE